MMIEPHQNHNWNKVGGVSNDSPRYGAQEGTSFPSDNVNPQSLMLDPNQAGGHLYEATGIGTEGNDQTRANTGDENGYHYSMNLAGFMFEENTLLHPADNNVGGRTMVAGSTFVASNVGINGLMDVATDYDSNNDDSTVTVGEYPDVADNDSTSADTDSEGEESTLNATNGNERTARLSVQTAQYPITDSDAERMEEEAMQLLYDNATFPEWNCLNHPNFYNITQLNLEFKKGVECLSNIMSLHKFAHTNLQAKFVSKAIFNFTMDVAMDKLCLWTNNSGKGIAFKNVIDGFEKMDQLVELVWNCCLHPIAMATKKCRRRSSQLVVSRPLLMEALAQLGVTQTPTYFVIALVHEWTPEMGLCGAIFEFLKDKQPPWYGTLPLNHLLQNIVEMWQTVSTFKEVLYERDPRHFIPKDNDFNELGHLPRPGGPGFEKLLYHAEYFQYVMQYVELMAALTAQFVNDQGHLTRGALKQVRKKIEETLWDNPRWNGQMVTLKECNSSASLVEWCLDNMLSAYDIAGILYVIANMTLDPEQVDTPQLLWKIQAHLPYLAYHYPFLLEALQSGPWSQVSPKIAFIIDQLRRNWRAHYRRMEVTVEGFDVLREKFRKLRLSPNSFRRSVQSGPPWRA